MVAVGNPDLLRPVRTSGNADGGSILAAAFAIHDELLIPEPHVPSVRRKKTSVYATGGAGLARPDQPPLRALRFPAKRRH